MSNTISLDDVAAPVGVDRAQVVDAAVAVLEELGSDTHVLFGVDARRVDTEELRPTEEEEALIAEEGSVFTARIDPASTARVGRSLRLAVDPAGLHFFDPETGERLLAPERSGARAEALSLS